MLTEPENILILRLGGIGEVLATTPALQAIRARFDRARITLLAETPACDVARPWVDEVIEADSLYRAGGPASLFKPAFYAATGRFLRGVLGRKYDLFLDFHHRFGWTQTLKPLVVSVASRAPRRVGFGGKFFLTDPVPDPDDRHMTERNGPLLEALGIPSPDPRPLLRVAPDDARWIDHLLTTLGLAGKRVIALSPGSSRPVTRWGMERFRETSARLASHGLRVVIGSPSERTLGDAIGGGTVNLAGLTTVGQLAALLDRCALLVSNDSGPLHMAYALGTPVVGIFRPVEYRRWGAYPDQRRLRAFYREGPGAQEGRTLPLITVDEVVAAGEELLRA